MVAAEFEVEVLDRDEVGVENMARKTVDYIDEEDLDFLQSRPPVVTVMGHVDHGKVGFLLPAPARGASLGLISRVIVEVCVSVSAHAIKLVVLCECFMLADGWLKVHSYFPQLLM